MRLLIYYLIEVIYLEYFLFTYSYMKIYKGNYKDLKRKIYMYLY